MAAVSPSSARSERMEGRVLTPIWYIYRDGGILTRTGKESVRARNIAHNPRVNVCVQDERPACASVTVCGQASIEAREGSGRRKRASISSTSGSYKNPGGTSWPSSARPAASKLDGPTITCCVSAWISRNCR